MIVELSQHIANLLFENDCVIIPDFGGFILHYMPARRVEEEQLFLPPYKVVGFNSGLKLNDGLLIQSYMMAYDLNYPDAYRMVEEAVVELKQRLAEGNEALIQGVGTITLNIENEIVFKPNIDGVVAPPLYGLCPFEMRELTDEEPVQVEQAEVHTGEKHNTVVIRINKVWLRNVAATAAAVILFFCLSTPVDNTYVEPESYASIGNVSLFEHIRSTSVATSLVKMTEKKAPQSETKPVVAKKDVPKAVTGNVTESVTATSSQQMAAVTEPKVEKTEKATATVEPALMVAVELAPTAKVETPSKVKYHIIVASVTTDADGEKAIQFFADKGYPGASIVKGDGRVRIAIASFSDKAAADARWTELRQQELFQNAWIWTSRNN